MESIKREITNYIRENFLNIIIDIACEYYHIKSISDEYRREILDEALEIRDEYELSNYFTNLSADFDGCVIAAELIFDKLKEIDATYTPYQLVKEAINAIHDGYSFISDLPEDMPEIPEICYYSIIYYILNFIETKKIWDKYYKKRTGYPDEDIKNAWYPDFEYTSYGDKLLRDVIFFTCETIKKYDIFGHISKENINKPFNAKEYGIPTELNIIDDAF